MKKNKIILPILSTLIVLALVSWKFIFQNDFIYIFKLWLTLLLVGLLTYPLTSTIFSKFHDKGWIFSKIIGVTISGWIMWLLSYSKLFEYSRLNSYLVLTALGIANAIIIFLKYRKRKKNNVSKKIINLKTIKNILITELVFIICLSFWTYLKGMKSEITNVTEQFMDYGFMNSMMNSKYMPPEDIWFSGNSINYYYYGQYISGFVCKIANLNVNEGYNLINALLAACTFVMPYTIGYNLLYRKLHKKKKILNKILPYALAITMGIGISLGGSLHYPIYRWFSNDKDNYSYSDGTRFIGYNPETFDKAVTEMPAYSSILGDLHAQYIVLLFSFTQIALLYQYFITRKKQTLKRTILNPTLLLIAFIFGIQKMTNYWDFPIYLVIISSIIIAKNLICKKFSKLNIIKTVLSIIGIIIIEELVTLPFSLDLHISSAKVFFTDFSSPIYNYAILWGLPIICIAIFTTIFFWNFKFSKTKFKKYLVANMPDVFVFIISLCALGLIILPEIVYLKDIYGVPYLRFNTMFKLTYEAFILFGICVNYSIFKLISHTDKSIIILGSIFYLINSTTFLYGVDAIYTNFKDRKYQGISASEKYLEENMYNDYVALQWIKKNIEPSKVILETSNASSSYTTYSRISVFSGNPTVLGWFVHQWLWRMNSDYTCPDEINNRENDIYNFYYSTDVQYAKEFLKKYNVSYIYIGDLEYKTYPYLDVNYFKNLGTVVYQSDNEEGNKTFIIEVN